MALWTPAQGTEKGAQRKPGIRSESGQPSIRFGAQTSITHKSSGREYLGHVLIDAVAGFLVVMLLVLWVATRIVGIASPHEANMPAKVTDEAETQLYLEPGGLYTQADIAANGRQTASSRFAGFVPRHDLNPRPGDAVCPITRTKANPQCSWIIGGQRYEFCCPPCIDEFLQMAKTTPEEIEEPEAYVQSR